ncbi:protein ALP1-like [Helianthus annuus]|uniref:protein ALP1-like n=1 Tax=Helianthus annuus TaxID=4232 RepID=UPI0016532550|nr:protein ALP1-like [Helianthus annuus]
MYTRGDQGHPTIILEAVASQDLWIWHAFFGIPGSNNNVNVLQNSEVFDDVIKGIGPDTSFTVSGVEYRRGYYLADGIYPQYSTIVKTVRHPPDEKRKKFAKFQEAARKDIERCFGVLQKRWHIIENPACAFTPKTLRYCIYACILLHNMIFEDEGNAICEYDENAVEQNNVAVSEEQQDLNSIIAVTFMSNGYILPPTVKYESGEYPPIFGTVASCWWTVGSTDADTAAADHTDADGGESRRVDI